MRAFLGFILLALVALAAGVVGFQAGVASNIGTAGGAVYLGGGFPGIGFLFFFLFIGLLFFAFAGRRRGPWGVHGGPGRWGPGPWGDMSDSDPRRQWIAEAHRRLHEADAGTGTGTGAPPTAPSSDTTGRPPAA